MSFPRYPRFKASGVDWLGEVPEHWDLRRVRWLCKIQKRIAGKLGHDVLSITQQGIKIKDLEGNEGQLSMDYSKYQLVEIGDFAMNHMDLLTGYVDISPVNGVTSPDYRVFTIRDPAIVDCRYLLYLFQMGYKDKIFYAFGQGSSQLGRWRLPTEQFNDLRFPLPTKSEQQDISQFLDYETTKIDALIAEQQRLLGFWTEKMAASVLAGFSKGSTQQLRLAHACTVITRPVVQEEGAMYTALGLFNRGRGLFHKDPKPKSEMGDSDFFWVEEGNLIFSGQFAWEGAVAMAAEDETGCVVSHRYQVIRGKKDVALTEYLFGLFLTSHGDFLLNENSRGAAGRNRPLNINTLLKEKIPIPEMRYQESVAEAVYERKRIAAEIKRQTGLLYERRSALISAAVTGKIDVRGHKGRTAA